MQPLSTCTSFASLFGGVADHGVYYYYRYGFQGCFDAIIQGRWKQSGRRGRYREERWQDEDGCCMFSYTSWFLASPFIPVTVVIHTATFYNYNFGERQRWNGQVKRCGIFDGTFGTFFINGAFSDAVIRKCSIEDHRTTLSTLATSYGIEQACRYDPTSHSYSKDDGQGYI